jgi:hypothetical protein
MIGFEAVIQEERDTIVSVGITEPWPKARPPYMPKTSIVMDYMR